MTKARNEIIGSQTVEGTDVGDVIRGRFPEQLPQDQDSVSAAIRAAEAGRIDVRDFRQDVSVDQAYGIAPGSSVAIPAPAAPVPAAPAAVVPAAPSSPARTGVASETARLAASLARVSAAWSAERWSAEAERRRDLRAVRRPELRDARAAFRSARRQDPTRTTSAYHRARRELRRAKRRVPNTLPMLAGKAGLLAALVGYVIVPRVPGEVWGYTGLGLAAAAILGFGSLAWWIHRHPKQAPEFVPTEEETQLLARLAPEFWKEHAEERGLEGTVTGNPQLGSAGIEAAIRLDGKWTLGKLLAAEENVRALLGARTGLRIQFTHGAHGGWASIALRTRSAADDDDLLWSVANSSFGIDTITGDVVDVPIGQRILIAGTTGAGKSVASRPLLYKASEGPTNVLVIIDFKKVEGRLWDHRARVVSTPEEAIALIEDLVLEMTWRLDEMPKGTSKWTPNTAHPRISVVVDEGAEAIDQLTAVPVVVGFTEKGKPIVEKRNGIAMLGSIARMGRAPAVDLWWLTQKPMMSGAEPGITPQIAGQMNTKICLAVSTPAETRVVLGEDAQGKGWNAEELPAPGVALVRDGRRGPHPIAVRHMTDEQVIALPDRRIWELPEAVRNSRPSQAAAVLAEPGELGLVLGEGQADDDQADAETPASRVLDALAEGPLRQKEIEAATGLPKSTLSRTVNALIGSGTLVRQDDGTLAQVNDDTAATGA
jgi:S-DNA-T family DNA segregation ATPase FtsK/SpoIIIE